MQNVELQFKAKSWLIPLIVGSLLFLIARPVFAEIIEREVNLAQYIAASDVEVGVEAIDGFSQVYYLFNGEKKFISKRGSTNRQPYPKGEYITYVRDINGAGQIFLYHLTTESTTQLTQASTNLLPKVSRDGRLIWQRWVGDRWQIFLFDGTSVSQISEGDTSFSPEISRNYVVYTTQDVAGTYKAILYSIDTEKSVDLAVGSQAKRAKIRNGKIFLTEEGVESEFSLRPEDLLLLDLEPLSKTDSSELVPPENVTPEEIKKELEENPYFDEPEEISPQSSR